jgi:hypothetical protein
MAQQWLIPHHVPIPQVKSRSVHSQRLISVGIPSAWTCSSEPEVGTRTRRKRRLDEAGISNGSPKKVVRLEGIARAEEEDSQAASISTFDCNLQWVEDTMPGHREHELIEPCPVVRFHLP